MRFSGPLGRNGVKVSKVVLLFGLVALAGAAAIVLAKIGPRNVIGMIRYDQRQEGSLRLGDRAPDVELLTLDGESTPLLPRPLGGRPMVLIFGSFT